MEQKKMIWLSTSLFCSKTNWHYMLQHCIRPLTANDDRIKNYIIEFNYLSGENIRMALLTNDHDKENVVENADTFIKNYFNKANLTSPPVKLPVSGVFMPFPANSVQYGLYPPVESTSDELSHYVSQISLSKIILAALQDEIDDEMVLTFAFYLKIGLVKAIYQTIGGADNLLSILNLANSFKPNDNAVSNLNLMKEITDDVMRTEKFEGELEWLNWWIDDCKNTISKINKGGAIKNIYQQQIQIIYRQTGINAPGSNMLNYFVFKSLEQYFLVRK